MAKKKNCHFVTTATLWVAAKNLLLSSGKNDSFEAMIQILDPTAKKMYDKEIEWKLKYIGNVMKAFVKEKLKAVFYEFNYALCCLNVIIILLDAFIENLTTILTCNSYFVFVGQVVNITLDHWTSQQGFNYVGMSAHWIDDNWNLQFVHLAFFFMRVLQLQVLFLESSLATLKTNF